MNKRKRLEESYSESRTIAAGVIGAIKRELSSRQYVTLLDETETFLRLAVFGVAFEFEGTFAPFLGGGNILVFVLQHEEDRKCIERFSFDLIGNLEPEHGMAVAARSAGPLAAGVIERFFEQEASNRRTVPLCYRPPSTD